MFSLDQLVWVSLMILVNRYSNYRIIDNVLNSQSFMTEHFGTLSAGFLAGILQVFQMWMRHRFASADEACSYCTVPKYPEKSQASISTGCHPLHAQPIHPTIHQDVLLG